MEKTPDFLAAQKRNVFTKGACGALTILLVLYGGYHYAPIPVPSLPGVGERLGYTLQWQALSLGVVLWSIQAVASKRLNSRAADPISGKDQDVLGIYPRFATNTLEQYVCSVSVQLMLATHLEEHQMRIIPLLVFLFVFGRIAFLIGYKSPQYNRTNRAYGFAINISSTYLTFFYVVYRLFSNLLGF